MTFRNLFRRKRLDEELNAEIESHLAMAAKDHIEAGKSPEEARLASSREFGNKGLVSEITRDMHGWTRLESLWKDTRYAARALAKNRTFSLMAILALALGIGTNTAIFTVVNAVLLRPLPYPKPAQLMRLWDSFGTPGNFAPVSYPNFLDWRAWNHTFSGMATFGSATYVLTGSGKPMHLGGIAASANLFRVLGVHPLLGRDFLPSEDQPKANRGTDSIIISYGLWQGTFGADPHILGRPLVLDGQLFTVIGIMPRGFQSPTEVSDPDFWISTAVLAEPSASMKKPLSEQRNISFLKIIGRLKPGVTAAQAQADMNRVAGLLIRQDPKHFRDGIIVQTLRDSLTGDTKPLLLLLLGAAGTVLLLVCADVAGLVLARTVRRQRELTIRAAVGATRWRIVRHLLVESAVLTLAALLIGVAIAALSAKSLRLALGISEPISAGFTGWAFVFAFLVAVLAALFFSLAPVLEALQTDAAHGLKESSVTASASHRQLRLQNIFIAGQIALTMVLLSACSLFTIALIHLQHVDLGFRPDHVLTFPVDLSDGSYTAPQRREFTSELLARLSRLHQVESAGIGSELPLDGNTSNTVLDKVAGRTIPQDRLTGITYASVSSGYFRALVISLQKGRGFNNRDTPASLPVVILNQTATKKYFGSRDPVGQQVEPDMWPGSGSTTRPRTIVGIVKDVKIQGPRASARPMIYWPAEQIPPGSGFWVIVHTTGDPLHLLGAITAQVQSLDKNLPVDHLQVLMQSVEYSLALPRHYAALIASFAFLAILLTAIGLYGVISQATAQRTQEIGIRMALGASPSQILSSFLRHGLTVIVIGAGLGLLLSLLAARLLHGLIFGVPAEEPLSFAAAAILLFAVTTAAIYFPARRAARINLVTALRHE